MPNAHDVVAASEAPSQQAVDVPSERETSSKHGLQKILKALLAVRDGDFSVGLPSGWANSAIPLIKQW